MTITNDLVRLWFTGRRTVPVETYRPRVLARYGCRLDRKRLEILVPHRAPECLKDWLAARGNVSDGPRAAWERKYLEALAKLYQADADHGTVREG